MNKKLLLIAGLLAITGCKEVLTGSMIVTKDLSYVDVKGATQVLPAGQYSSKSSLTVYEKDAALFEVIDDTNNVKHSMKMNVPKDLRDKYAQRTFKLSPAEVGQPFGLDGEAIVSTQRQGPFHSQESCVYDTYYTRECRQVPVRYCDDVGEISLGEFEDRRDGGRRGGGNRGGGDRRGGDHNRGRDRDHGRGRDRDRHRDRDHHRRHCHTRWETRCHDQVHYVWGSKDVEYYTSANSRFVNIKMVDAAGDVLGEFKHYKGMGSEREIVSTGPCQR